jgi:bidirectional [NiFe] hydrogenase diaphorase subunit
MSTGTATAAGVKKSSHPSDDKRWKVVDVVMRRNGRKPHALIETLHAVQDCFGYLDTTSMRYVAESLGVPLSKVYGVATFYHLFTLKPAGRHTCVVCTGTACYIKGAGEIVERLAAKYNVQLGETTEDRSLSLISARCLGACGLAPAAVLDGTVLGKVEPGTLLEKIQEVLDNES